MKFGERVAAATKAAIGIFSDTAMQEAYGMLAGIQPGGMGTPPARGVAEYLRAYSQMPWLRAVAGRVATAVASTEWQVFILKGAAPVQAKRGRRAIALTSSEWQRMGQRARLDGSVQRLQRAGLKQRRDLAAQATEDGELVQITDHPMLDAMHNANSFQTGQGMRKVTQLHLDLVGEAFWLKERAQGGPLDGMVTGVWPVPPNWILSTPTPQFRFFRVGFRGWRGAIPDTEFVWFSDPDPANPYARGSGTAMSLADELETDEYTAKHLKAFFYNRARPDLIIWPKDGNVNEGNVKRLEQDWLSRTAGFWRAFKPYFMTRAVEVKELDQNFRQLALVPLREFERNAIMQVFGMPPEILGVLQNSNRSTIDAADFLMQSYIVVPRLEFIRSVIQERLAPEYDERIIVDYPSPVKEDEAQMLSAAKAAPWALDLDEWRAMTNHKPMDNPKAGALRMVSSSVKPMSVEQLLEPPPDPTAFGLPGAPKPAGGSDDSPGLLPGAPGSETPDVPEPKPRKRAVNFELYRLAAKSTFAEYSVGDSFTDDRPLIAMTSLDEALREQGKRTDTVRVKITTNGASRLVTVAGPRAYLPAGQTFAITRSDDESVDVTVVSHG